MITQSECQFHRYSSEEANVPKFFLDKTLIDLMYFQKSDSTILWLKFFETSKKEFFLKNCDLWTEQKFLQKIKPRNFLDSTSNIQLL